MVSAGLAVADVGKTDEPTPEADIGPRYGHTGAGASAQLSCVG